MSLEKKIEHLDAVLHRMGKVIVAYSGGVDSTYLLAHAARTLGRQNVTAVTAVSETYPTFEMKQARRLARKMRVRHILISTRELENKRFRRNPRNRCFYCKDELFGKLTALAQKNRMTVCDATNYSDRHDYRPGRKAAAKWEVASPLADARLTKDDIRLASRQLKLPTWNMPAQACLASRFPYGSELSAGELARVERGETFLRSLGLHTFRLRHHGAVARIEADPVGITRLMDPVRRAAVVRRLQRLGWTHVTVDLEGYRCGSFNYPAGGRRR